MTDGVKINVSQSYVRIYGITFCLLRRTSFHFRLQKRTFKKDFLIALLYVRLANNLPNLKKCIPSQIGLDHINGFFFAKRVWENVF